MYQYSVFNHKQFLMLDYTKFARLFHLIKNQLSFYAPGPTLEN